MTSGKSVRMTKEKSVRTTNGKSVRTTKNLVIRSLPLCPPEPLLLVIQSEAKNLKKEK